MLIIDWNDGISEYWVWRIGEMGDWGNEEIAWLHDCIIYEHPCIHASMHPCNITQLLGFLAVRIAEPAVKKGNRQ